MNFVDLWERRVLARYDAVGQMNFVSTVWDPTWAPAQVRRARPRPYFIAGFSDAHRGSSPALCASASSQEPFVITVGWRRTTFIPPISVFLLLGTHGTLADPPYRLRCTADHH